MVVFLFYGVPVLSNLVGAVEPDSPAAQAGIQKGDRIVAVDGQAVTAWDDLSSAIKHSGGQPLALRVQRSGEEVAMTVQPRKREVKNIFGELKEDWMIGIGSQVSIEKGDPGLAVSKAFIQTYEYSKLTLIGLYKMITREVSPRNLRRADLDCPNGWAAGSRGHRKFFGVSRGLEHQSRCPQSVTGPGAGRWSSFLLCR